MSGLNVSIKHCVCVAAIVLGAGLSAPAAAELKINQTPLYIDGGVKPNFIMAMDDSISMGSERTFPGGDLAYIAWNPENQSLFKTGVPEAVNYWDWISPANFSSYGGLFGDGSSPYFSANEPFPPLGNFGFARSSDFNLSFFDPARTYLPWRKADGTRWPDADPKAARVDPRPGPLFAASYGTLYDFTDPEGRKNPGDKGFFFLVGMTVPSGIVYHTETDEAKCEDLLPGTGGAWKVLEKGFVAGAFMNGCTVNMAYFPATFFLRPSTALPASFGYAAAPEFVPEALGPGASGLNKYEIRPENFASAEAYKAAIQNFANWFQYHRNRFLVTVAAMTESLSQSRGIRVSMFPINDRVDLTMYDMDVASDREALFDQITNFQATAVVDPNKPGATGTPNRDAVYHMGEQLRRTDENAPILAACQINAGMLFTDGYTTKNTGPAGLGNVDGGWGPPYADAFSDTMADIAGAYYSGSKTPLRPDLETGRVPVPAVCTEGEPGPADDCETDLHMRFHAISFGPTGAIYGVQPGPTQDPYANPPDWNGLGSPKGVDTPVVVDELWHASLNGRGSFVNANSPAKITEAMQDILANVASSSFSGGNAGSGSRRDGDFLSYVPTYSTADWTGDLSAYSVGKDGKYDTQVWSAADKLADMSPAERKIYFVEKGSLKEFTAANLSDPVTALGLPSATPYGRTPEEVINYLRGEHSLEKRFPGGAFRDRASRIGDIFGSQPEVLNKAGYGYTGLPENQGGGKLYADFVKSKEDRTPVAFVGANDGMLHAFDASAGENGGKELFAIIPEAVLGGMGKLPDPGYVHQYYVDGSPVQGDAYDGSRWKTVLLVPMGAGGRSIVALDATDPAEGFDKNNFLWEFKDADLHYNLGKPHIVLLKGGRWAAVFTSGLDVDPDPSNTILHHVYAIDLFTGELISKAAVHLDGDTFHDADGAVNLVPVDTDFDLYADTIYAADYDGYLWRFEVDAASKVSLGNGGLPLFRAAQGRPQIVTGGIDSYPHHIRGQMVFFGTGRYLEMSDRAPHPSSQIESFYAIWDDPENKTEVQRSDLLQQTILSEQVLDGVAVRAVSDASPNWTKHRGWVFDFGIGGVITGEKFIGHPTVALGKVIFASYTPQPDACGGAGINRLYSLSAVSGAGEYSFAGGDPSIGSAEVPAASAGPGPILSPTLVATPPAPICMPGSPGCDVPPLEQDEEGNVLSAPSPGCRTALGMLLGDKLLDFSALTCGRQSWRQVQ